MKTSLLIIRNTFIWLFIIFIILYFSVNYFAGKQWVVINWVNFCKNQQYSIWKILWWDNLTFFCDNKIKWKCINWIKSYTLWINKDLYMSFDLPEFIWKTENEINDILDVDNKKGWVYNIFQNDYSNKYYAKKYGDIISYLKLDYDTCSIDLYSRDNISQLNEFDKQIFQKLK